MTAVPSPADVPRRPVSVPDDVTVPNGYIEIGGRLHRLPPLAHDLDPQLRITYWNHPCPVCQAWVPKHRAACPGHEEVG